MRRIDQLISQIRRQTENEDSGADFGIQTEEFIQYINDAQHRLQSLVTATHPTAFVQEEVQAVIKGQQEYALSDLTLMDNKVSTVEYSDTGREDDYYHLEQISLKNRTTYSSAHPCHYIRRSGKILLQPTPDSLTGTIRINYVKRLYDLDIRRGKILAVTTSGNSITNLQLDTSLANPQVDIDKLRESDYICVCDKDGNMKMRNIPITGINSATGALLIESGFEFQDGETLEIGDFVVAGKDAVTHSELPKMCERYLIAYAAWKILKRDSSVDSAEQEGELRVMEEDIVNSFAYIDDDVHRIPEINRWW